MARTDIGIAQVPSADIYNKLARRSKPKALNKKLSSKESIGMRALRGRDAARQAIGRNLSSEKIDMRPIQEAVEEPKIDVPEKAMLEGI